MPTFNNHFKASIAPQEEYHNIQMIGDTKLFIDPFVINTTDTLFAENARLYIHSFFRKLLTKLKNGEDITDEMSGMGENDYTHLGYSDKNKGRGLGKTLAEKLKESLSTSKAISTGLVGDIEDMAVFIFGINNDITSDMITNIILEVLVDYTMRVCSANSVPMKEDNVINYWNIDEEKWKKKEFHLPVFNGKPVILVPEFVLKTELSFRHRDFVKIGILGYYQLNYVKFGFKALERKVYVGTDKEDIRLPFKDDIEASIFVNKNLSVYSQQYLSELMDRPEAPKILSYYKQERANLIKQLKDRNK